MLSRCSTTQQEFLPSIVHLDFKGKLTFLNCFYWRRNNKSSVVMHNHNEDGDKKLRNSRPFRTSQWDPLSEEKKRKKKRKLGCGSVVGYLLTLGWHCERSLGRVRGTVQCVLQEGSVEGFTSSSELSYCRFRRGVDGCKIHFLRC